MPKTPGVYRASNGTWYFKLRHSKDPDTGKWQQVTRRGFVTASEAAEARRTLAEDLEAKASTPPRVRPTFTVAELVERYHQDAEAMGELTRRTLYDQRGYLRNSIAPHIGEIEAAKLTAAQVRQWMVKLGTDGGKNGQPLMANTIRLCRSLLLKTFSYAVANDLVDRNPVEATDPPKKRKKVPEHWTPDQARQFLAFHEGDRLYPLWSFMLSTGVRPSDFVWLRWANVDLTKGIVRLQEFPTAIGWELIPSDGKTSTTARTVDLDSSMIDILRMQAAQQRREAEETSSYQQSEFVFTKPEGGSYHPQTISKTLTREIKRLGLPRLTAKGLRHTCATLMLHSGIPPKVAAERLGHADTRMFSDVYSHVTPSMQQDAADRLGKALFD